MPRLNSRIAESAEGFFHSGGVSAGLGDGDGVEGADERSEEGDTEQAGPGDEVGVTAVDVAPDEGWVVERLVVGDDEEGASGGDAVDIEREGAVNDAEKEGRGEAAEIEEEHVEQRRAGVLGAVARLLDAGVTHRRHVRFSGRRGAPWCR